VAFEVENSAFPSFEKLGDLPKGIKVPSTIPIHLNICGSCLSKSCIRRFINALLPASGQQIVSESIHSSSITHAIVETHSRELRGSYGLKAFDMTIYSFVYEIVRYDLTLEADVRHGDDSRWRLHREAQSAQRVVPVDR
jgi:hypothetical protein